MSGARPSLPFLSLKSVSLHLQLTVSQTGLQRAEVRLAAGAPSLQLCKHLVPSNPKIKHAENEIPPRCRFESFQVGDCVTVGWPSL